MKPFFISFCRRVVTVSGSVVADRRLLQVWMDEGVVMSPGENPKLRPSIKKRMKSGLGWLESSFTSSGIITGVLRWLRSQLFEGLLGFWGQVRREWAPPQNVQVCNILQDDRSQPPSLKLLHTILFPMKTRGRPRRSLALEVAGYSPPGFLLSLGKVGPLKRSGILELGVCCGAGGRGAGAM